MIADTPQDAKQPEGTSEMLKSLAKPLADVGAQMIALSKAVASGSGSEPPKKDPAFAMPEPTLPPKFPEFLSETFLSAGLFDGKPKNQGAEAKNGDSSAPDSSDPEKSAKDTKKLAKDNAEKQAKTDKGVAESDKKMWADKLANAVSGFGKLAKVRKKYAIAAALINVATGITETFKQHGFPFAIPFAAALAAQGAQQIAAIKGQAHSGLDRVPSTGTYLLEKGERVVGKRLNADLSGFLRASAPTSNTTSIDRSHTNSSHFNPTINMRFEDGSDQMAIGDSRNQVERMIREIYADYAQTSPFGA